MFIISLCSFLLNIVKLGVLYRGSGKKEKKEKKDEKNTKDESNKMKDKNFLNPH